MTHVPHLSGAVDLSKVAAPKSHPTASSSGASYAIALDEQNLNEIVQKSAQLPVFLVVWSATSPAAVEVKDTLVAAVNAAGGRTLVGTIDAEAHPQIVSALRAPSVPFVVVALSGQLQPLYAQSVPEAQVRELVQQVIDGAAQQGLQGTVEPFEPAAQPAPTEEPQLTPAQQSAQDLFDAGHYLEAVAAWQRVLAQTPNDDLAARELRRSQLMARVNGDTPQQPAAVAEAFDAADRDFLAGHLAVAFNRLLSAFQTTSGDDREAIRLRLLDLFTIAGDDPAVPQARGRLAGLLF